MRGFEIASIAVAGISALSTIILTVAKCKEKYKETTKEINEIKSKMEADTAKIETEISGLEEESRKIMVANNAAHAAKMAKMERIHDEKMRKMDSIGEQLRSLDLRDPSSIEKCNELLKELYNV